MSGSQVSALSHLDLLCTLLGGQQLSLLFQDAILHVLLEEGDGINLRYDLNLDIKAFKSEFISSNSFLDQWDIGCEVYRQFLGYVCDKLENLADIRNL